MAPIILYGLDFSPPVRACIMVMKSLNLEYKFEEINLFQGQHLTPEYVKMNPLHTIPTMDDNGYFLGDSHAICAYLVDKYGKDDSLYPKDLQKRGRVNERLHFDSGVLFSRLRNITFPIFTMGVKEVPKEKEEALIQGYDLAEKILNQTTWLAGEQMTIADICAFATISSIVGVIPIDASKFPKLTSWLNRWKQSPLYQFNQPGVEALTTNINKFLGRN